MSLETLVRTSSSRNDRSVTDQWVVNSWVRNQVSLELIEIDVQSTIETKRRGDGADNLSNQSVEVLERRTRNVQVATADIVDSFVIDQEGTIGVFDSAVGAENSVIWLDNSGRNSWSWVNCEFELGFLAIVGGEALKQEGSETRTGSTTERVKDQETLERRAVILVAEKSVMLPFSTVKYSLTRTRRILSRVPSKISFPIV